MESSAFIALGSNLNYVPAKSYASIAVDAFKPTLQRLQNDAANTAQANYFQNFQIQTRDQFDKFRNEFENDPDGMKNAVDAYSKTLLEKTPAPYKIQANAMLASYSQNSILYAAGNKRKIHENLIKVCIALSLSFLVMYIAYHITTDPTPFGGSGLVSYIYFFILITHILLSIVVIPMVLVSYSRAFQSKFASHKKIAKVTFPVWLYVAVTGVIVYLMISPYYS